MVFQPPVNNLGIHGIQELAIILGSVHFFKQKFEAIRRIQGGEEFAQDPDPVQGIFIEQQFFLAGAGFLDVDGREDSLVGQAAIQLDLHVAGALELLEDDFVHARTGID
ncbi:conserved hypothetical protein [Desulfosarcina cetonica]|nr:conserved hypothetical protein [Desulfosarcina cetonica]